jgi:hypothetical protein
MVQKGISEKSHWRKLFREDDSCGEMPLIFPGFLVEGGREDKQTSFCHTAISQGRIVFQRSSFE